MADNEDQRGKRSGFTNRPIEAAQHGPPASVQFVGVAEPPVQPVAAPRGRSHADRDAFFYTIPERLLCSVCSPQVGESFKPDEDLLSSELVLSRASGDHSSQVGFWNDLPIRCNLMGTRPLCREDLASFGLSESQITENLLTLSKRLLSFAEITCGYAGWLMTNPEYLGELGALIAEFGAAMQRWGTAMVGIPIPGWQPSGTFNPTAEEGWAEYDSAVLEFCLRWRLQGLAGPRIPVPMRPMMAGQFPLAIVEQLMRAGGVFNWPDTFPVFARDELREMLTNALQRPESSEHLAGWHHIIGSSNKAKNQIGSLERRFRFQHFWRLLRERHAEVFNRRLNRIERAFAEYFGVDESTIRLDRTEIAKALGKNWDLPQEAASPVRRPR